jgi:starvation-inducible DNA-binding protein
MTPKAIISPLSGDEDRTNFSAHDMVSDLIADHQTIAKDLHALIALATKNNDPVTADLATVRSAFHEKAIWMLQALLSA